MNVFITVLWITVPAATEPVGTPIWVPIVIFLVMVLLFWWGLTRNAILTGTAVVADDGHHVETAVTETVPAAEATAAPDDLKRIEGIGPKIEGILNAADIQTFSELAAAEVTYLEKIVREDAGIRVAFPDTWPQQAALAAAGKWDELEQLQDELTGGREAH